MVLKTQKTQMTFFLRFRIIHCLFLLKEYHIVIFIIQIQFFSINSVLQGLQSKEIFMILFLLLSKAAAQLFFYSSKFYTAIIQKLLKSNVTPKKVSKQQRPYLSNKNTHTSNKQHKNHFDIYESKVQFSNQLHQIFISC